VFISQFPFRRVIRTPPTLALQSLRTQDSACLHHAFAVHPCITHTILFFHHSRVVASVLIVCLAVQIFWDHDDGGVMERRLNVFIRQSLHGHYFIGPVGQLSCLSSRPSSVSYSSRSYIPIFSFTDSPYCLPFLFVDFPFLLISHSSVDSIRFLS
jgi:hypothetical protein